MTENPVNVVMAALLVALACGAAIVRLQPPLLRKLADWANARADSEDYMDGRLGSYKQLREVKDAELRGREERNG